jgi:hypothetical protein
LDTAAEPAAMELKDRRDITWCAALSPDGTWFTVAG